jgi:DNA-binding response OmpR family regulator
MDRAILLVEDEENDVLFFKSALRKAGITNPVQSVRDGQEALNYFYGIEKFSDREIFPLPTLVLLDLKLPYVMGLDVLKSIRAECESSVVVIVLSSSTDQEDIDTAYRLGANAYLVKPNETEKLAGIARAIRDFWLLQNQFPTLCETAHRNAVAF